MLVEPNPALRLGRFFVPKEVVESQTHILVTVLRRVLVLDARPGCHNDQRGIFYIGHCPDFPCETPDDARPPFYVWTVSGGGSTDPNLPHVTWGLTLGGPPAPPLLDVGTAEVLADVQDDVLSVDARWPAYNSAHEGLGVLLEEFHELQQHVFTNQRRRDLFRMRREAIDIAVCAVRFARDVCDDRKGRK